MLLTSLTWPVNSPMKSLYMVLHCHIELPSYHVPSSRRWKRLFVHHCNALMNKDIDSVSEEGPQDSVTESAAIWAETKSLSRQDTGLVGVPLQEPLTRVLNPRTDKHQHHHHWPTTTKLTATEHAPHRPQMFCMVN